MERLTKHTPVEFGYAEYVWNGDVDEQDAISRLAAYEDSGLSPDEVQELAKAKAEGRCVVLPEPKNSDYPGLKVKYRVYKAKDNTPVENCFVLRPNKDPAAISALTAYAKTTDNNCLAEDILNWITPDEKVLVLPCKVGDTVYHRSGQHTIDDIQLFYPRQNGHVPEERIGKLQIRLGSLNYAGLQTFATYADEIGKTVFLTREEAEAALEKQEGAVHERD